MKAISVPPQTSWLGLQTELRDLAFALDRKGHPTAADVASMIAVRIGELLADKREKTPSLPAHKLPYRS